MGTSSTSNITVLAVTIEGETFAYLSCQFLPCYACHFFEAIFFFFFLDGETIAKAQIELFVQ